MHSMWHHQNTARWDQSTYRSKCQIHISCCLTKWLYIPAFSLSLWNLGICLPACHALSSNEICLWDYWPNCCKWAVRHLAEDLACQARVARDSKPWFQTLHHLISSSQAFCLERLDDMQSCNECNNYVLVKGISCTELLWLWFSKELGHLPLCL